jgi:hypothetical protein
LANETPMNKGEKWHLIVSPEEAGAVAKQSRSGALFDLD